MSTGQQPSILDLVEADLRGTIDQQGLNTLFENKDTWRNELVRIKRRAETQMTSCKARLFTAYAEHRSGQITEDEYIRVVGREKVWRTNTSRFLQQIESRMTSLKYEERSSNQAEEV